MDCSLPGSSIHVIFQARVLEWGAISFSGIVAIQYYISYRCTIQWFTIFRLYFSYGYYKILAIFPMLYNIFLFKDFFWYEPFLKSSLNFLQYCCCFVFWFFGCKVYGMWELVHKEGWAVLKNWCFRIVVLEKTLESPLDRKEIKPVNPKRNQPWIFIGRVNAEAEAPILWPPNGKNWLLRKDPWCWERLKAERERDDRGQDGWMASPTQWIWV